MVRLDAEEVSSLTASRTLRVRLAAKWLLALATLGQVYAQAPRNPHGPIAFACENCHTTTSWAPLRAQLEFDHNRETKFALRGMHNNVKCTLCHVSKVFAEAGKRCADCHADLHRRQFGAQCENCHTVRGWKVATRSVQDHQGRFPLLGAHAAAICDSCHRGAATAVYTGLSTQCAACHLPQYQQAVTVNHQEANFPITCETCHSVDNWQVARFDHDRFTKFPLTGAHRGQSCVSCHVGGRFQATQADCLSCHATDFARTTNPNHIAAGFPKECATCHTSATWPGAKFDHGALTKFALAGAHAKTTCAACHVGGRFAGTPQTCVGCHTADFEHTTNPDHRKSNFSTECQTCHTTEAWQGAKFDHLLARFALTGKHTSVACSSCHVNSQFTGIPSTCVDCHRNVFEKTVSPPHVADGFPTDCSLCHTTVQWTGATFDHSRNRFPLTGKHATTTCAQCHSSGQYSGLNTACATCHLPDFQKTTNPNHAASGFPETCESCHTSTTQWTGAVFNHSATKFPLTGKHTTATCATCHVNSKFAGFGTACATCHLAEFQKTTNPNHAAAGFSTTCETCHTTTQWPGAVFNHSTTRFPLTGKHTTATCATCHVNSKFAGLGTACATCHLPEFQKTTNPNHAVSGFPVTCESCHTTTQWTGAVFNHSTTRFPLTGKHTTATCTACHVNGKFAGLGTACSTCHLPEFQKTTNPNHTSAGFTTTCETCHTTTQWTGAVFNHSATKFPLTGKHTTATCTACHVNGKFAGLGTACATCHLPDFQKATNPNHAAGGFPATCETCHTTTQWTGAVFNHNSFRFQLTGKHATVTCQQCHSSGQYATLPTTCVTCHLPKYQATTNPNHAAAGFPTTCETCHTTTQWPGAVFNHSTTRFPLTGKHTTATCTTCHVNGKFAGLGTACVTCHLPDFQKAANPNHASAGFPTTCETCHTTTQWSGAVFNHNNFRFPLTGKHATVTCQQCHSSGQYATLPTTCVACHLPKYQATANPNHAAAGFPTTCETCHTTSQWPGAVFNHSTTKFPLTGKHATATCATCHVNSKFAGLGTACATCHLPDFQKTTNPNHVAGGFPTTCETCHTTTQWTGAVFNHNNFRFPLTGKHGSVTCQQCHSSGQYATLPTTCVTCHLPKYQATTNPNHAAAGFPTTCETCHTTSQWPGARFDHNAATKYPLTGKHVTVACAQCHSGGVFKGLPSACVNCHLSKYQATTNPNHTAAGFPTTCETCHTTIQWPGAVFNHSTTRFPLTGRHGTVTCAQCHVNGVYKGLPMTCVSCHLAKYQATTTPNHVTAGFPQDCSLCHSTTQWPGAVFNHSTTAFPLTGKHATSVTCAQCHVNGVYKGTPRLCVDCHLAKYQATTAPNHAAAGFPTICETCHTTTQWPGAVFNHSTTAFPLTGKHTTTVCSKCHVNNVYRGTPKVCYTCHASAYSTTTNPNHAAAAFPTTCETCHTTIQWLGATFNHTWFPITTGNHRKGVWNTCADCHQNATNYKVFTCTTCHLQTNTDSKHRGVRNYVYNSTNCYSCHPQGRN